jgi:hypothetical protein
VRYFLDTEFNGWGGALLSLALVPDDGEEFYVALTCADPMVPWVERHVVPYLHHVPEGLRAPPVGRREAADQLSAYLGVDPEPEIVADWPEDFAQFCNLLLIANGDMVEMPPLVMRLMRLPGFSPARASKVPHNALHDARALRNHVVSHLE